jgi:hypothetical protein
MSSLPANSVVATPNRKLITTVTMGFFGLVYGVILFLIGRELSAREFVEVMGIVGAAATAMFLSQWLFSAGSTGELEKQSLGVRIGQICLGGLMFGVISMHWFAFILLYAPGIGRIDDNAEVLPIAAVSGIIAGVLCINFLQRNMGRYQFVRTFFWIVLGWAIFSLVVIAIANIDLAHWRSLEYASEQFEPEVFAQSRNIQIFGALSVLVCCVAAIWCIPVGVYLIAFRRSYLMARNPIDHE